MKYYNYRPLKKLMVGGTSASFKSILCKQIDNHPQVNVIHRHDKILQIFIQPFINFSEFEKNYLNFQKNVNYLTIKDDELKKLNFKSQKKSFLFSPILLRKLLLNYSGYYVNEQYAWLKKIGADISSISLVNEKFDFNFIKYDTYIFQKIFKSNIKNFSPENLYDLFLEAFLYAQNKNKKKYVLFMAPNNYESINFAVKEKFNIKIIYLMRNSEDIVLTRAIREIVNTTGITNKKLIQSKINKKIENILYANFYRAELNQRKKIINLEKLYPKMIKTIRSEDLIYKNKQTIKKIIKWIGITDNKSINKLSYEGTILKNQRNYLGKINDNDFTINDSIKNFFYIQKFGIKKFIFNNKNKTFMVIVFLIKGFLYKIINIFKN